jgi:hypothetical protein
MIGVATLKLEEPNSNNLVLVLTTIMSYIMMKTKICKSNHQTMMGFCDHHSSFFGCKSVIFLSERHKLKNIKKGVQKNLVLLLFWNPKLAALLKISQHGRE